MKFNKKIAGICVLLAACKLLTACAKNFGPNIHLYEQPPETTVSTITKTTATTTNPEPIVKQMLQRYEDAYTINQDLVGWLSIPGTQINNPIVQSNDNEKYLTQTFAGESRPYSDTIFADFRCDVTDEHENVILYGHSLLSGEGLAKLQAYYPWRHDPKGSLEFYKTHPVIKFNDVYDEDRNEYAIFAAAYLSADPKDPMYFDYAAKRKFKNENEFREYIIKIMDRSVFYTDIDLEYGDRILTLATCMDLLGKNNETRFVIFARRIRKNEDVKSINVNNATINKNPMYFGKYYEIMGGSWDESKRAYDISEIIRKTQS